MSPLTRLFVVLLVLLSLALTAGTIVFVNQVDDFQRTNTVLNQQLTSAKTEISRLGTEVGAAQAREQETSRQLNTQLEQAKQQMNGLQQQLVDKDTQLGQAKSTAAIQAADLTRLAEALKASEDTKSRLQTQLADLRGTNDKLVAQNAQLNQSVTDLTNRLEVSTREFKFVSEQLAEFKGQVEKQGAMLRDAGISQQQLASATVRGAGAPAINGVVRAVKPIAGIPYATISVGAADSVARGMEFKVLSAETGDFLGVLTVDSVELQEATGRLSGPRVNEIKPNAKVKTQL